MGCEHRGLLKYTSEHIWATDLGHTEGFILIITGILGVELPFFVKCGECEVVSEILVVLHVFSHRGVHLLKFALLQSSGLLPTKSMLLFLMVSPVGGIVQAQGFGRMEFQ